MMLVALRRYGDAVGALREQVDRGRAMESETAQIDRAFEFRCRFVLKSMVSDERIARDALQRRAQVAPMLKNR